MVNPVLNIRPAWKGGPRGGWFGWALRESRMPKYFVIEGPCPARKPHRFEPRTPSRLSPGPALIAALLISLGLWWVVWIAVSSLIFWL